MEGVAALDAAKRQPLTACFIYTSALRTGAGGVSRVYLDDLKTRTFGLVAEDVEELSVSPCAVMIASLTPSGPGPLADAVKPLHRNGTASRIEGNSHKFFCAPVLEVLGKPCLPSGDADKGPRARTGAFGLQLAPKSPVVFLPGLEMLGLKEVRVVSGRSDSQVAAACIHAEDAACLQLRLLANDRNVKFVTISLAAAFVDKLRCLDRPVGRLKVVALKISTAGGELLSPIYRGDRDDTLDWIEPEVSPTSTAFEIKAQLLEAGGSSDRRLVDFIAL